MKRIRCLLLIGQVFLTFCSVSVFAETVIVRWDFDDENIIADEGTGTFAKDDNLGSESFYSGNPGSSVSYSSWAGSLNLNEDYVEITVSSQNLYQLAFSFDCYRTSSGPERYRLLVSNDNFNSYSQLSDQSVGPDAAWHAVSEIAMPAEFSDQPEVKVRIYGYQASHGNGRLRLDNVLISGIEEQSLSVTCTFFQAVKSDNQITIAWHTESEVDVLGYYVLRSVTENGDFTRISHEMIAASGNGSSMQKYVFVDHNIDSENTYWYQIEVLNTDNTSQLIGPVQSMGEAIQQSRSDFLLYPGYPNPFNPSTTIRYYVPEALIHKPIDVKILNIIGQEVITLHRGIAGPGLQKCFWNGCDAKGLEVSAGLYFVCLQAEKYPVQTQRILKVK